MTSARVHWLSPTWASVWIIVFAFAFFTIPWPYVDVVNVLRDATSWSWQDSIRNAFSRDVEYRPLFTLGVKAAYQIIGLRLWWYQALVLLQFIAALALLIWLFRPLGVRRAIAACMALSCVVGLHSTRILFGFWPLNHHSGGLVLLLLAAALALDPRTRPRDWIYFPLTVAALMLLESGLIIAPLIAILWWVEAPGVGLRGVLSAAAGVALYLVIRLGFGAVGDSLGIYTSSGLGFSDVNPETLRNIFEHAPWLFWSYNVVATFLTVLASEPRAGVYRFVESLLRGQTPLWQWIQVGSSLLTTALMAVALFVSKPTSTRDRLLLVVGVTLIVLGSALGFLYTRDRIALSAGVGYAVLLYVMVARLLEDDGRGRPEWQRRLAYGAIAAIGVAWIVRSAETFFQLRDSAWDLHLEWTDRYAELGGPAQPQTALLQTLRSAALQSAPDDPRRDPSWTYALFERRFRPGTDVATRPPDAVADNVVRPPSSPFDIRWKPEVDDAARARMEAELGLSEATRVDRDPSGRTWTYRLRQPSRDRVRAIVMSPLVEDTAKIDTARFEILN
jgi:hypothetical protein